MSRRHAPAVAPAAPYAAAVVLSLAGCAPATRAPEPPPAPVSTAAPAASRPGPPARDERPGGEYRIVREASELRVLVYRGGPLARLGHNHVLVTRDLDGELQVPPDGAGLRFTLSVPVASFVLDDPAARAAEGPEFESRPTPADVEGTRRNLEGPEVLDAVRYPQITIRGLGATGGPDEWRVRAAVTVRGQEREVAVPARVERDGDRLVARGEFPLRQSDLGLTPFSVAMGALQVRDDLTVRYVLTARRR